MADETSVYQQVWNLMEDKPNLVEIRPVLLVMASAQDRSNTLLQSTRKLLTTAIVTTLTLTVAICGLILQLANS